MTYILIIMLFGGSSGVTTQEFGDRLSCDIAATAVMVHAPLQQDVAAFCVGKGA
jgi:hypothetical protein